MISAPRNLVIPTGPAPTKRKGSAGVVGRERTITWARRHLVRSADGPQAGRTQPMGLLLGLPAEYLHDCRDGSAHHEVRRVRVIGTSSNAQKPATAASCFA